ncbi:MAG: energy transducer TonB [Bacteroides sp.]|nr:energy transducer TonB [Bacteroides sp.]
MSTKYIFFLLICGPHVWIRSTSARDTDRELYLWASETEVTASIVCGYPSGEEGNRCAVFPKNDPMDTFLGKDFLIFSGERGVPADSLPVTDSTDPDVENDPFVPIDCMPEYPGSQEAMKEFFARNLHYPEQARKDGIEGRVVAEVIIAPDGQPTHINIIQKADPDLDKEVIRMLRSMPYWIPCKAHQRGVRVRYVFPFEFRLPEDTVEDKQVNEKTDGKEAVSQVLI